MSNRTARRAGQASRHRLIEWGAHVPDDFGTMSQFDTIELGVGRRMTIGNAFKWVTDTFPSGGADAVVARGYTPLITLEPWVGTITDANWTLTSLINGTHDAALTTFANGIASWGKPIWLRFAHEMNGNWYSWSERVNGNSAGQYVQAWQHVYNLMHPLAPKARWVWCPNEYDGTVSISALYPGDGYCDWVGFDSYNFGSTNWRTPSACYDATLSQLASIAPTKPVMIAETGCGEVNGSKSTWLGQMFSYLAGKPQVAAMLWYDQTGAENWPIESSAASISAFRAGITDSRWRGIVVPLGTLTAAGTGTATVIAGTW